MIQPVMAPRFTNFQPRSTVVRIDHLDDPGIDLTTVGYLVSFGGAKDDVGTVIVARPRGFDALTPLLPKLPHDVSASTSCVPSRRDARGFWLRG
jgi:hypothetical protein